MAAPSRAIQADEVNVVVREAMDRWSVPGVALGILQRGEIEVFAQGVANRETGQLVTPATLFQVGSISKVFTATLVMQLVDQGLVNLDVPINAYLPSIRLADASAAGAVTLRHLLTHTAGFYGDRFDDFGYGDDALSRSIAGFDTLRQYTPPGELWAYCNTGFQLAGAVIESVLATTFEDAMRQRILEPLHLEHTFYHAHDVITRPHAVGHNTTPPSGDERPPPPSVAREWGRSRCRAAQGGITSNVVDLLRFAAFHLGDGRANDVRVLSTEALLAMQQPIVAAGMTPHWGIGWSVDAINGIAVIGHGGTTNGFQAGLTLIPEYGVAFACLTNSNLGAAAIRTIGERLMERLIGLRRTDPPQLSLQPEQLAVFAGRYERPDIVTTISASDDGLLVEVQGKNPITRSDMTMPARRAVPVAERTFLLIEGESAGSTFDFIVDGSGSLRFLRYGGRLADRVA
ncbi:MAG: serine hydrolase domain-containing protein [Dehalococcoidia bacterium]